MFGWFRARADCPIDEADRRWLDERWRWLEDQFGGDLPLDAPLILPRPQFFPDPYSGTEADARRMLDRVCGYMGLDPATVELSHYAEQRPTEGRWDGTAGLYSPEGDKFRVWVESANLADPLALVGVLAHELGHVHLLGHKRLSGDEADHEPLTDLLTVFFGMGVFTANSVIRESSWNAGTSSGWSMGRQGYLAMPHYGYAFALYARSRGEDGSAWERELRLDVRSAFRRAMRFLAAEDAAGPRASPPARP